MYCNVFLHVYCSSDKSRTSVTLSKHIVYIYIICMYINVFVHVYCSSDKSRTSVTHSEGTPMSIHASLRGLKGNWLPSKSGRNRGEHLYENVCAYMVSVWYLSACMVSAWYLSAYMVSAWYLRICT